MPAIPPTIVVGVDGSDSSRQALDWAVEEATRRQLSLHLLSAWQSDYAAETVYGVGASPLLWGRPTPILAVVR